MQCLKKTAGLISTLLFSPCLCLPPACFCFPLCRLWGPLWRRRPAVIAASEHPWYSVNVCIKRSEANGPPLPIITVLLVQPPLLYVIQHHIKIKPLCFHKRNVFLQWSRCLWILRVFHIAALEKMMMVLWLSCLNLLLPGLKVCGFRETSVCKDNYTQDLLLTRPVNVQSRDNGQEKCEITGATEQLVYKLWNNRVFFCRFLLNFSH